MSKTELITAESAMQMGLAMKSFYAELAAVEQLEEVEGAIVASYVRLNALKRIAPLLAKPEMEAMILFGGREAGEFEIADGIPDHLVLSAAKSVMCKGYLLSDEAGPHFTIIAGKGGRATHLIKEAGHRFKLAIKGAKHVDVQACAVEIRPRPNNGQKFDMAVVGFAACEYKGQKIRVQRTQDLPMFLPCYPSDGPDKYEAQGRRRLLRDLWAAVSGSWEPIEADEVDQVEPVKIAASAIPVTEIRTIPEPTDLAESHRLAFENQVNCIVRVLQKVPDAKRAAIEACIDAIRAAEDVGRLAEQWPEILGVLDGNGIKPGGVSEVEKLYQMRLTILRGDL
jgi:hypothetical protein